MNHFKSTPSPQLQATLELLQQATQNLQDLLQNPVSQDHHHEVINQIESQLNQALISLKTTDNPPNLDHIPPEILKQIESLEIPWESLDIQRALSNHHLSQIIGIITEINNKSEQIRNRKDYFLARLPQIPIEKLGPRVPVVTAADFLPDYQPLPPDKKEELKAKYHIDHLIQKRQQSRSSLFERIKQAEKMIAPQVQPLENNPDFEDDLPF
ncbi:conserved hypothetical protein [Planktothrix sp. PCC 11201]|uniref:hypothetical protein n=1 Tax=Planktothrix sp. PCC 11201 TaxID=1729650 RepID=UPI0009144B1D|nr:hypothetical protein [Planktothrix sp. PCC 11201]SKB12630.1 conserved hypothetical protein [Planktothrix sp. PCC 11201]